MGRRGGRKGGADRAPGLPDQLRRICVGQPREQLIDPVQHALSRSVDTTDCDGQAERFDQCVVGFVGGSHRLGESRRWSSHGDRAPVG